MVGTDVAARGLDVDDIDVVIHLNCKQQDSFVHRSGRTARKGKKGLNILFFEREDIRFVLDLERDLNIEIEFANEIGEESTASQKVEQDGDQKNYGKFVDKLHKTSSDRYQKRGMRIDQNASEQIYEALSCPDLDNLKRKQYVQYLIDFYVSKTHMKLEPVGFISGKLNQETYGITNVQQD